MNRKEVIEQIKYDWKRIQEAEKELNRIWSKRFKELSDRELEDFQVETSIELQTLYDDLNDVKESRSETK